MTGARGRLTGQTDPRVDVVRACGAGSAVRFDALEPADREPLDRFVPGVRRQLARRFAAARAKTCARAARAHAQVSSVTARARSA